MGSALLTEHFNRRCWWRERTGILKQLRNEVRKVGCEVARDRTNVDIAELDSPIIGDLGRSGTYHVSNGDWLAPSSWGLLASEYQEVLCVATHTSSKVVEAEEVLEGVGI